MGPIACRRDWGQSRAMAIGAYGANQVQITRDSNWSGWDEFFAGAKRYPWMILWQIVY